MQWPGKIMTAELVALSVLVGLALIYRFMCLLEPAAFVMTRKMLLGLRRRAETAARSHDVATRAA